MWRAFVLLIALGTIGFAGGDATAREAKEVSEVQSKIWISLEGRKEFRYHGWNAGYSNQISRAYLLPDSGDDPAMALTLVELAPDYGFVEKLTPEWAMKHFSHAVKDATNISSSRMIGASGRQFDYLTFDLEGMKCFGFTSVYGAMPFDDKLEGNVGFGGFYCTVSGDEVKEKTIRNVLQNIGVKAAGAPVPR